MALNQGKLLEDIVNWWGQLDLFSRSVRRTWTTVWVTIFLFYNLKQKQFSQKMFSIGLLICTLIFENQGLLQTLKKFQVLQIWIFF